MQSMQKKQQEGKVVILRGRRPQPFEFYVRESDEKIKQWQKQLKILKPSGNEKEYKRVYN